ncbi:MAG: hypothetical protein JFR24_06395 [Muribaculaceae bacterium]|jgi:hypothetical protein|nr:hypothetical protein [Muribaculaceae bacterium]
MVKEYAAYLKGKLDASAMLSRLNAALVEEWRYYRRRFMADEMARERRRRSAAEDDDVAFLRRFALY